MGNFDKVHKNIMTHDACMMHALETALTLFQVKQERYLSKPYKSSIDSVNAHFQGQPCAAKQIPKFIP